MAITTKLVTRLMPMFFAGSRAIEVIEALVAADQDEEEEAEMMKRIASRVSRDLEHRRQDLNLSNDEDQQQQEQQQQEEEVEQQQPDHQQQQQPDHQQLRQQKLQQLEKAENATSRRRTVQKYGSSSASMLTKMLANEARIRKEQGTVTVPLWIGIVYLLVCWSLCVFALVRIGHLGAACEASASPLGRACRRPAYPIFDMTVPGPEPGLCACNALIASPLMAAKGADAGDFDCTSTHWMETVKNELWAEGRGEKVSDYVQIIMSLRAPRGCAINNTYMDEMLLNLRSLRLFDIRGPAGITPPYELPSEAFSPGSKLMSLRLTDTQLERVSPEIGQLRGTLSLLVLLSNPRLTALPEEVGDLQNLGGLFVERCGLTEIPSTLGRLPRLANIGITTTTDITGANGGLTAIPSELGALPSLLSLYITGNPRLERIPSELGNIASLYRLDLSSNGLVGLPVELGNIPGLDKLYLQNNQLRSLPSNLGRLQSLRSLSVGNNKLAAMPPELSQLSRLYRVIAADNQLQAVPSLAWASLKYLNLEANLIEQLPDEWELSRAVANVTRDLPPMNEDETATSWGNGFYDNYVEYREEQAGGGSTTGDSIGDACLVLMHGNDKAASQSGGELIEMTRRDDEQVDSGEKRSTLLVSFRGECAPGCLSTPWKAAYIGGGGGLQPNFANAKFDGTCSPACESEACSAVSC